MDIKKILIQIFDKYCGSVLYTMKYHSLYHMVKKRKICNGMYVRQQSV